jgi:hypothetical protein
MGFSALLTDFPCYANGGFSHARSYSPPHIFISPQPLLHPSLHFYSLVFLWQQGFSTGLLPVASSSVLPHGSK